ncbi:MAG: hypothetical protein JXK07_16940 [Spirochaetes bacterium]|nr:hypothetical protein [Spirochaetota bacterium]MBN2772559.1 hypothetical protein [Spirochaetota bacterium]
MGKRCGTKYPILMVHGAGFRDDSRFYNYWGRIPKALSSEGARIFYSGQDAWGSIEYNGTIIKERIEQVLKITKAGKVNIIAHSRGGLEARYAITKLAMGKYVASLTTISTPHYGSKTMNIFYKFPKGLYWFVSSIVNLYFKVLGDKNPDFFTSSRQFSTYEAEIFNKNVQDDPHVLYQSYAAKMKNSLSDPLFIFTHLIISFFDGENDGLCPVASARWGNFKGVVSGKNFLGISHAGVIDSYRCNYSGIDLRELYITIVEGIKNDNL